MKVGFLLFQSTVLFGNFVNLRLQIVDIFIFLCLLGLILSYFLSKFINGMFIRLDLLYQFLSVLFIDLLFFLYSFIFINGLLWFDDG